MVQQIANAIIIADGCVLLNKKKGRSYFVFPGRSIEENETPEKCITRELHEEFKGIEEIIIRNKFIEISGYTPKTYKPIHTVLFFVDIKFDKLAPNGNIEDLAWHDGTSILQMSPTTARGITRLVYNRRLQPKPRWHSFDQDRNFAALAW